jgi:hypothetical protein
MRQRRSTGTMTARHRQPHQRRSQSHPGRRTKAETLAWKSKATSAGGLFRPLPEKRPQPSQKLGPSFQMRQVRGDDDRRQYHGQGCFPFLRAALEGTPAGFALAGFLFSFSTPAVFTMELNPRHRHIKVLELANPAVRTRKATRLCHGASPVCPPYL